MIKGCPLQLLKGMRYNVTGNAPTHLCNKEPFEWLGIRQTWHATTPTYFDVRLPLRLGSAIVCFLCLASNSREIVLRDLPFFGN